MLTFLRKIRKSLIDSGSTRKYILYAIGEILLVVIGILIALQINNWNEERKAKANFDFGLKELYTQLKVNFFDLQASRERVNFQLNYIDSIQNFSHLLNPEIIPGIIQLQDYAGLTSDIDQRDLFEPFLKLVVDDKVQNKLAKSLRKTYFLTDHFNSNQSYNFYKTEITIQLMDHLRAYNIPIRFMRTAPFYKDFIKAPSSEFYTIAQLNSTKRLLEDPGFQADLKSIQHIKQQFIQKLSEIENIGKSTLTFLDKNYPNSIDHIDKMEIIGSGIPSSNWAIGIPMKKISEGAFEIVLELINGEIKFRTDQNYTYDWGGSQMDVNELAFKGANIPVNQGLYKIKIDINDMSYSLTKMEI